MQFFIYFTMGEDRPMSPPSPEGMAKMGQLMKEAFDSGIIVSTGKLPQQVTYVEPKSGDFTITDGPFTEGKEIIPGYTVIDVESKEKALEWAKSLRECMGDGIIKVAQLSANSKEDIKM